MIKTILQKKWVKKFLYLSFGIFLLALCFYASIYFGLWGKLPDKEQLSSLKQAEATQVLDHNGRLIGKYYIYDRQPITYDHLPQHLIDALIATEDVRFYEHNGVDNTSLLRVFFKTILLGNKSSGGGSTITLQLAKNLFGRKKHVVFSTVINKIKESFIAKRIEDIYSKKEILTLYFNTVPFPDNTYGIESASQKFFNKSTHQLNLSEAATLIGTLKANHSFNPRLFPERSQLRRDVVLQQMAKYGYISTTLSSQTMSQPIILNYQHFNHDLGIAPYFREEVKKELANILEHRKKPDGNVYDIYNDGLIVHTTLDYKMQLMAEEAMKEHMPFLQKEYEKSYGNELPWKNNQDLIKSAVKNLSIYNIYKEQGLTEHQIEDSLSIKKDIELFEWSGNRSKKISSLDSLQHYLKFLNAGMIAIEANTGAVQAYLGGIDYRYFKYDHVSQSERQVGSTFKPFVYTTAIENGMKPCSYFSTREITYTNLENWTPKNASVHHDPHLNLTLEKALSNSVNTIAVKVLNKVGIPKVVEQIKKLGITSTLSEDPAMALGTDAIKLKELAGAYASYVNQGKNVTPFYISHIEDKNGHTIASFKPKIADSSAYSDYTRLVLLEMMKSTVKQGTATRLKTYYNLDNDIAGKTGTTQDNKDGWFVAVTPNLIIVTWVGNDNNIGFKTTTLGQGANTALPIFARLYQKMNQDSYFDPITKSKFEETPSEILKDMSCKPEKRDNFFKRLFGKKRKKKRF